MNDSRSSEIPKEPQPLQLGSKAPLLLRANPNIYLFVIESFRDDVINEKIAPNLFAFKQRCIPIEKTLSNANGTHLSWYSLFHSQFSYNWRLVQQQGWSLGSLPLLFLKNLGYKIHLNTSAQLGYYDMESLLFGKQQYLLDTNRKFLHDFNTNAAMTDHQAVQAMIHDIQVDPSRQNSQIFITFLDATHFDYSWPKHWKPKFTPFAKTASYFSAFFSKKQIQNIKNRYQNAVNYVDSLFGEFLQHIPNKEEAIIIVTGDHGEEFFEKGHLFHCSHIVNEQTHVPILMYFGGKSFEKRALFSQMDIFPSIIDYLTGRTPTFLSGHSIFRENPNPFVFISRFNAGRTPYEFCIHNGKNKLIGRFINQQNILDSKMIKIVAMQTTDDVSVNYPDPKWIQKEFGDALKHLFPSQ